MDDIFREYVPVSLSGQYGANVKLLLDTGAVSTVVATHKYPAVVEFKTVGMPKPVGSATGDRFYVVARKIPRLYVCNICLGTQFIWTTDDIRVSDSLLGMDMLCQLNFAYFSGKRGFQYRAGTYQPNSIIDYANRRSAFYTLLESANMAYRYDELLDRFPSSYEATYEEFVRKVQQMLKGML